MIGDFLASRATVGFLVWTLWCGVC